MLKVLFLSDGNYLHEFFIGVRDYKFFENFEKNIHVVLESFLCY